MGKTRMYRIDEGLIDIFGKVGKEFAEKVKKDWNLTELFVPDTLASQVLAGKYNGQKIFDFKVEKVSLTKGRLILI